MRQDRRGQTRQIPDLGQHSHFTHHPPQDTKSAREGLKFQFRAKKRVSGVRCGKSRIRGFFREIQFFGVFVQFGCFRQAFFWGVYLRPDFPHLCTRNCTPGKKNKKNFSHPVYPRGTRPKAEIDRRKFFGKLFSGT